MMRLGGTGAVFCAAVASALCAACGDSGTGPADTYDVRDVREVDVADVVDVAGGPCGAPGDCPPGQFCSAAGHCIAEGTCLVPADCPAGEHCGLASFHCLGEGECAADGDCDDGFTCDEAAGLCVPGGCGGSEFTLTLQPPNMMIVLDRSGTMERDVDGRNRWEIAKEAVSVVTTAYDAQIRFGLATFSACLPGGCSPGTIVVPIADANAAAINGFLEPLLGEGSDHGTPPRYLCSSGDPETSTGRTLLALVGEPSLQDPTRDNAVLLVTDGGESDECTSDTENGPLGAGALYAQTPSVHTYVVGFSRDVPADALTEVAVAGGTGTYYQADSADDLIEALDTIAGAVATCEFRLEGEVPDPSEIYVYFNDDPAGVGSDPADGWTYDPATGRITFHGASCDRIMSGEVDDIDVVYGCPGPVLG